MGTYMEIYGLIFFEVGTGIGLYELMSLLFSEKFIDFFKKLILFLIGGIFSTILYAKSRARYTYFRFLLGCTRAKIKFGNVKGKKLMSERINYVPIYQKVTLTIKEASEYSNIGINKIDAMLREPNCPFVLFVGVKKLVKRKEFEEFISKALII